MILDHDVLMLPLNFLPNFCANLISNVVYMRSSIGRANWVHKRHLIELPIWVSNDYLPVVARILDDRQVFMLLCVEIKLDVVFKPANRNLSVIHENLDFWTDNSSHVIGSLGKEGVVILIQGCHFELLKIGSEGNAGEVFHLLSLHNFGFLFDAHIVPPNLHIVILARRVIGFNLKEFGVDVC